MRALPVLFVCTANICRSPYMELTARRMVGPGSLEEFASAGTHGFHARPMDPVMAETLADTDPAGFLSRRLTTDLVDLADLVLTAEASHRRFVIEEHPAAFRKVFTLGQFAEGVRRVGPGVHRHDLVEAVGRMPGIVHHEADVADPYARGPRAAAACAEHIDRLLEVVVPALTGPTRPKHDRNSQLKGY